MAHGAAQLVCARPAGAWRLALVVKRAYRLTPQGRCIPDETGMPIEEGFPTYDPAPPRPFHSPPRWDSDLLAFKQRTDLVVQGSAYTYGAGRRTVDAEILAPGVRRIVRVHGDRRLERQADGQLRFTPAEPFEQLPIRYDRAYGGVDAAALARYGHAIGRVLARVESSLNADATSPYHYPRNPAGCGFLTELGNGELPDVRVPNLELPFDPVTPDRLAVRGPRDWPSAPLPAGFDWYAPDWFPRLAHLGTFAEHDVAPSRFEEVRQGWATPELVATSDRLRLRQGAGFLQGAAPGLALAEVAANETFVLRNLFATAPEQRVELPGTRPVAHVRLGTSDHRELTPHLNAVVICPDEARVVLVWSCVCDVARPYRDPELSEIPWEISS